MAGRRRSSIRSRAAPCLLLGLCWAQDAPPQQGSIPTFGTTVVVPAGLRGQIYFVPPGTFMLPKFEVLKPAGSIYTASLNVWPREFSEGFPGVTNRYEWFAIDYTGRFWIEKPGEYRFSLTSDDGAKLYIDDRVAINNDGIHEPQTVYARVALSYGVHRIRVSYFQGPRYLVALVLSVAGPHEKWRVFSTNEFKPPPNPEDWKQGEARELPVFPEAGRRSLRGAAKQEPFETEALAALKARPLPHAFDFRAAAFRFGNGGAKTQTSLAFEVPGASLTATPQPGHKTRKLHLSLLALGRMPAGRSSISSAWTLRMRFRKRAWQGSAPAA